MSNQSIKKVSEILERSNCIISNIEKQIKKINEGEKANISVSYCDNGARLDKEETKIILSILEKRIEKQKKSVEKEQKIADAIEALYGNKGE